MNIYIYGTASFKKEIHKILIDSNIKLKMGANNLIKEIESLSALKEIIAQNPNEIFLIDDSKIIKKNSFSRKIKFLTPKDAIEEEFLLNSGIADLSVDSLEEIPKYILKKYEQKQEKIEENNTNSTEKDEILEQNIEENSLETINKVILDEENSTNPEDLEIQDLDSIDSELSSLLAKNSNETSDEEIDNSIAELENLFVDDDKINSYDTSNNVDFNDNFGLNNISFDYDDSSLINDTSGSMSDEEMLQNLMDGVGGFEDDLEDNFENNIEESFEDIDFLDMILDKKEEIEEEIDITKELDLDNLLSKIQETQENSEPDLSELNELLSVENLVKSIEPKLEPKIAKGVDMPNDDFSELDLISEKDLLDALNLESKSSANIVESKVNSEVVNISSSNVDELATLFSKILNNKTLEITIKIKD